MSDEVLAFDFGQNILVIYCEHDGKYTTYSGDELVSGANRLYEAQEIISYNGKHYDILEIRRLLSLSEKSEVPKAGIHQDMRSICWSDRIWGSNLRSTYQMHFSETPVFPDTHEGSAQRDSFETFQLWLCWKRNTLKVLDGSVSD